MPPTVEKDREITEARALLGLRPGMTYCELGAASHHMTALGKAVMPGGHVVVTAPNQYQLDDLTRAAKDAGLPITALLASDVKMGIGVDSCDAILARMVYHMISEAVARDVYLPQLARALRRGGRVLILDHNDPNHSTRVNASLGGMAVVPKLQEIREFTDAGFALLRLLEWHLATASTATASSRRRAAPRPAAATAPATADRTRHRRTRTTTTASSSPASAVPRSARCSAAPSSCSCFGRITRGGCGTPACRCL